MKGRDAIHVLQVYLSLGERTGCSQSCDDLHGNSTCNKMYYFVLSPSLPIDELTSVLDTLDRDSAHEQKMKSLVGQVQ